MRSQILLLFVVIAVHGQPDPLVEEPEVPENISEIFLDRVDKAIENTKSETMPPFDPEDPFFRKRPEINPEEWEHKAEKNGFFNCKYTRDEVDEQVAKGNKVRELIDHDMACDCQKSAKHEVPINDAIKEIISNLRENLPEINPGRPRRSVVAKDAAKSVCPEDDESVVGCMESLDVMFPRRFSLNVNDLIDHMMGLKGPSELDKQELKNALLEKEVTVLEWKAAEQKYCHLREKLYLRGKIMLVKLIGVTSVTCDLKCQEKAKAMRGFLKPGPSSIDVKSSTTTTRPTSTSQPATKTEH